MTKMPVENKSEHQLNKMFLTQKGRMSWSSASGLHHSLQLLHIFKRRTQKNKRCKSCVNYEKYLSNDGSFFK